MADLKILLSLKDQNFSAGIDSACKKAKSSLDNVNKSVKGFSGLGPIFDKLSGQVGGTIGSLTSLASATQSLCNPYTAAASAVAAGATAFYTYNKNLAETRKLVQQFTGLDGAELDSLRNGIQSVADVADKDFRDVLSAVDGLMAQFGIDGETALKVVKDGFVAGADDSGKFLELLSKYSGVFNDIGVSADEMTAIIAQTRSGIFSEQGMELIKLAGKNIRILSDSVKGSLETIGVNTDQMQQKLQDGSMTTMEAIKMISGQLKKFPAQSKEVGAVLQAMFEEQGATAGYELVTALSEVSTNLEEVKKQTGDTGDVMDDLVEANREYENALQSVFGIGNSGFDTLGKKIKYGFIKALTAAVKAIGYLRDGLIITSTPVILLINSFITLGRVATKVFASIAKAAKDLINGDFDKVGEDIKGAVNIVSDEWENLKKKFDSRLKVVADIYANWTETDNPGEGNGNKGNVNKGNGNRGNGNDDRGNKGTGTGTKSSTSKSAGTPKFADGSLTDLENKLSDLQKKYKDGLISITPEDYKKQVTDLENQINAKKLELGITPEIDDNSLSALKNQLNKLKSDQEAGNIKLSAEDFKNQVSKLEQEIKEKEIELGLSIDKDQLDKQFQELLAEPKLSSYQLAVGVQVPAKDMESQLNAIAEEMDKNDELLAQLKELQAAYAALGQAGAEGYDEVSKKIQEVSEKQNNLGSQAKGLNDTNERTKKLSKSFGDAGDKIGEMGSAFSSLGSSFDSPELNIAGTIAQGIASIIQGAGSAIAQAGTLTPFGWLAFSLTAMAQVAAMIAQIHSLSGYASGGVLGNGVNVGDKNIIRVNGNEMILNQHQQGRLWSLINSSSTLGGQAGETAQVEFKIKGQELVGVINNYSKKRSKI